MPAPYRDDFEALQERLLSLELELSAVQAKARELAGLKQAESELESNIDELRSKLAGMARRRSLPMLENVRVASPCSADWDAMIGDDRSRFCQHCQKDVYNISAMPRQEAEQFLRERTKETCIRVYRRTDGTVLTSDCPVGVKRARRRKAAVAVGGGLLAAGVLATPGLLTTQGSMAPSAKSTLAAVEGPAFASPPHLEANPEGRVLESPPHSTVTMGVMPMPIKPSKSPAEKPSQAGKPARRSILLKE